MESKIIEDYLNEGAKLGNILEKVGVGGLVLFLRKRLHFTQVELAKRADIAQSTLQRIECGKQDPNQAILAKIFAAMECDFFTVPVPRRRPEEIL